MKVTFCTYDAPTFTGGPNSWLRRLLPTLRTLGIESEVLFFINSPLPADCPCLSALRKQGFTCHSFPFQSTTPQQVRWILSKLKQNPPDIFVPNLIVGALYASRWVKEAGIPTVGVLHSDDDFYTGVTQEFIFGEEVYQLSAVVCVSDFLTQTVLNSGRTTSVVIKIPCGVPVPSVIAQKPTNSLRLIYLGRLVEEQKQISKLTSALCRALRSVPNTEALIFGEGPAKANVQALLSSEGKGLPICLGDFVDNSKIQDVLAKAHVLVLLSDYEGLPVALMEAMACGVVPVCLNIRSGITELVEHDVTGLLVNNREEEFIAAIRHIATEAGCWERLSQAARAKVVSSYANDSCASDWADLFFTLQQKASTKQSLVCPKALTLPASNPLLASFDRRDSSWWTDITQRLRRQVNAFRKISLRLITNNFI
ncbi:MULTISPECIES: glycosyltransferase family 4 protein [unclassified Leptolyngbya]|uniref:glycosyltransferase family 4 protein n=1 Tax=unclassified Leptolyngbya TaxID=2650499 RepID=UPI001AC8B27F|nr:MULTISPECIES: glycosyltransferase family 4 protein [unclassified Leptolyngbya]MBN8559307.1 glycosyltransferase family 4 protein [Leptolyngbya sp. UWPOB_LEPTO1]MCY6489302.1 glycosyltransferase family 4 protein [Leptolyngbya sp. GGD]